MKPWMLAMTGRQRVLKTLTFTASATWIAPTTTDALISLVGEGADGSGSSWTTGNITLASASKFPSNSGGYAADRSEVTAHGLGQESAFSGSGERTVNYTLRNFRVGPDNLTQVSDSALTSRVRGSYTTTIGNSSGALIYDNTSTAYFRISIERESGGTTGASTTGFGKTFPGGVGGAAAPVTYTNQPVIGGTSYQMTIPAGGKITISYYE